MSIHTIAILGAGAVGSYMLWGLAPKADVCVVAEGDRAARLKRDGITINGRVYRPAVKTPQQAHGADLLIVALKYAALPGALDAIAAIVDDHTTVMSLMNGVDSEEVIGARIGAQHVLPALIKVASRRTDAGVTFDGPSTVGVIYGEARPPLDTPRVRDVAALMDGTGLHYRISEHINAEIWAKFRLNVCNNLPQAILGVGVGCYRDSAHMLALNNGLRRELEAIAAAKGINFDEVDASSKRGTPVPSTARYSTLQDLDAHRHTEVDMFAGALIRMGQELGIPTPYCECIWHIIKAMEEKNDGMFNYDEHSPIAYSI